MSFILLLFVIVCGLWLVSTVAKSPLDAFGEVRSVNECLDILSLQKSDTYKPLSLNYPTFKKWPYLDKLQKAVYLIDRAHLINVRREFVTFLNQQAISSPNETEESKQTLQESETFVSVPLDNVEDDDAILVDNNNSPEIHQPTEDEERNIIMNYANEGILLDTLLKYWGEFTSSKIIFGLFTECDKDLNLQLNWIEYLMCRNNYNQNGSPYDVSEMDYIENIVLYDFQQRLNDPTDPMTLELLARDEL